MVLIANRGYVPKQRGVALNQGTKAMAYLLAATSQSIGIIWFCYYISPTLESHFPISYSWSNIMMGIGLLTTAYIYFVVLRALVKNMDKPKG